MLKSSRTNRTAPFQACGLYYLGPVFDKNIIIVVTTRWIKLKLFYLHVVRQEQLYSIWLKTVLIKTLLTVLKSLWQKAVIQ